MSGEMSICSLIASWNCVSVILPSQGTYTQLHGDTGDSRQGITVARCFPQFPSSLFSSREAACGHFPAWLWPGLGSVWGNWSSGLRCICRVALRYRHLHLALAQRDFCGLQALKLLCRSSLAWVQPSWSWLSFCSPGDPGTHIQTV
jgi:hypothetical protein